MFVAGKGRGGDVATASQEQHVPHWTDIDWDPSIANRLTNDLRVRYLDYGSGPALVLLHGMAANWAMVAREHSGTGSASPSHRRRSAWLRPIRAVAGTS